MKIVYIHQYFQLPTSGGGTRSFEMARRLVERGHDVHIVTSDRDASKPKGKWRNENNFGLQIHWLVVPYSNSMGYAQRIAAFMEFAFRSSTYARRLRGDVIFATSTPLTIALPGVYASIFRKSPMVFEVRDLWPEVPIAVGALKNPLVILLARALERFAYRHAAHIVALSPGMKKGVALTGYPESAISVIPNASDLALFEGHEQSAREWRAQFPWLGGRPMVLYCGTLGMVNNVRFLAEVAAEAYSLDSGVRFVVVGAGAEENLIRARAAELGVLDKNFFMLESVPKLDVPTIFAAADVCTNLVLPIDVMNSNSANKFYDALAAGRPVAINYGGWHAALLEEHGAGIYLDPVDRGLAAHALIGLLHDKERLGAAGRAAHVLAESSFSRDQLAAELGDVLERAGRGAKGRLSRPQRAR